MSKKYRTRFPMSRIKKIMQTDEDIGKIAGATPVLVSKCVEMFLMDLICETYMIAQDKQVKTVSSSHLKQCINQNSRFDFLKNLVEAVPDVQPKQQRKKREPKDPSEKKPRKKKAPAKAEPQEELAETRSLGAPAAEPMEVDQRAAEEPGPTLVTLESIPDAGEVQVPASAHMMLSAPAPADDDDDEYDDYDDDDDDDE